MNGSPRDRAYMAECLALARRGAGRVSPNPMVGCVLVRNGRVLARGWHARFGGPHAEIVALRKAKNARGSTAYVSLEPCAHHGKTPPCADALIAANVARVVAAMRDPNPLVAGRGIRKLRAAGITVTVGVCEEEAREVNRSFITHVTTGVPRVTVKLAMSRDGKISAGPGKRTAISGAQSTRAVHRMRAECDAVLVGRGTLDVDAPRLTVRAVRGRNPMRIVLDTNLRGKYRPPFTTQDAPTMIVTSRYAASLPAARRLARRGYDIVPVATRKGRISLAALLRALGKRGIASVLVEGGAEVASAFLREGLADELVVIVAPVLLPHGVPGLIDVPSLARNRKVRVETVGKDIWMRIEFQKRSQ